MRNLSIATRRSILMGLLLLMTACSPATETQLCGRREVGSMGPENSFRLTVAEDRFPPLDTSEERIDIAFTIVPPIVGPVSLFQVIDGEQFAKWDLQVNAQPGIVARCSVGPPPMAFACGAELTDRPHPTGGYYSIEANGNRVLEAGLSFYLCDEE